MRATAKAKQQAKNPDDVDFIEYCSAELQAGCEL
jgi:hypothetical protein